MNAYVLTALTLLAVSLAGCSEDMEHNTMAPWPRLDQDDLALLPYLDAIAAADEPSQVVALYVQGLSIDRNGLDLHRAYVHRMAQLGLPQAAADQARLVTDRDDSDGLAWAVQAFDNAQAGRMDLAFKQILEALPRDKDDVFVLSTAGQLLAWYDHRPEGAQVTKTSLDVSMMASRVRWFYAGNPAFSGAYQEAAAVLAAVTRSPRGVK